MIRPREVMAAMLGSMVLLQTTDGAEARDTDPPASVLIFGGTRGVGLETVRRLRERGEAVTVVVRPTSDTSGLAATGAELVVGDALDRSAVDAAFATGEFSAVISTLSGKGAGGQYADSDGNINVMDAAVAAGVDRFLLVSSIGVGDSEKALPWIARVMLRRFLREKGRAEEHLFATNLNYTVIRPGNLRNGDLSDRAVLTEDRSAGGSISRQDVARLLVQCLGDPATYRKVYAAVKR
jgi:uncharacterized protein YbjT (DUF2867 family)